jgi:hypothetical protein
VWIALPIALSRQWALDTGFDRFFAMPPRSGKLTLSQQVWLRFFASAKLSMH